MVSLLLLAVALLILSVAIYITVRRQRSQGGLPTDSSHISLPRTSSGLGPGRAYTEAEVLSHATQGDLWLIIKDKVYNFTEYFALHPGGEAILRNAGKDSTLGFSGTQHPARVWDMVCYQIVL